MNEKLENLIQALKKEKLSLRESELLKNKIDLLIENAPVHRSSNLDLPTLSPYFRGFSFMHFSKIVAFSILITVLGIGGLSYASADALPGDLLYPIKINVKEKLEEKLAITPEEKIVFHKKKIETRFDEVEKLIKEDKITPENRALTELKIEEGKKEINENLEKINKENPAVATLAKIEVENSIQVNQTKIEILIKENEDIKELEALEKELESFTEDLENIDTVEDKEILNVETSTDLKGDYSSIISKPLPLPLEGEILELRRTNQTATELPVTSNINTETQI